MNVFSIPISTETKEEVLKRINTTTKPLWIVTVNPEILLEARSNASYANALRQADLHIVDGFGLQFMLDLSNQNIKRWPGIELAKDIMSLAKERGWRVAFLGGKDDIAFAAKQAIEQELKITIHAESGGQVDKQGEDDEAGEEARHRLTMYDPEVLLVAFGHPKQEMWIAKHADEFPNLKVIIGVGGSFDIWSGRLKRAPLWMRKIGLEWLWRLIQEPSRIMRILHAVIVFPIRYVQDCFS